MRLGVDFGIGTTVVAACGSGQECTTLSFDGISRTDGSDPAVHTIPSLIRYEDGWASRFGDEVARQGEEDNEKTARWIRRYVCGGSPVMVPAGGEKRVRYDEAASDFLNRILSDALQRYPGARLVFAIPPGAPPAYTDLLTRIAGAAGAASCSWIDESQAVVRGYGYTPSGTTPFFILSFTAEGTGAAVMVPETHEPGALREAGTATGTTGCRAVDRAIVQDLLHKFRLLESDPRAVRLLAHMQYEAGRVRRILSHADKESISLTDQVTGRTYSVCYTRADIGRVLAAQGVAVALQDCIGRALSATRARGVDTGRIRDILLIGEGFTIPGMQEVVQSSFPGCTVHAGRPLDAIARGAALAETPVPAQDRIARSYALRYWDPAVQEHHYRFLVHSGSRYPSAGQVARVVISATYDGQTHLGIPLYEIDRSEPGMNPGIELISDTGGGVRLAGPEKDSRENRNAVHANERSPTLLVAEPPARKGEPRFECTFTIDPERNLCLSARDLLTGALVKLNTPVYRMT